MDSNDMQLLEKSANDLKESTSNFRIWVDGCAELIKPWKIALILTNLFWAIILGMFIWFVYLTPAEMIQTQEIPDMTQQQSTKAASD